MEALEGDELGQRRDEHPHLHPGGHPAAPIAHPVRSVPRAAQHAWEDGCAGDGRVGWVVRVGGVAGRRAMGPLGCSSGTQHTDHRFRFTVTFSMSSE